ncbi:NDP-hexose 2,3-dehydratase family protein [Streptomyces sp. NPDC087300]|uniref:NDP-hexose 2,3-dehydratase family protein n=1 Tax=Streptomyces sp. NPDC087300 TaxID=3365780 RepID=UPI003801451D
MTSAPQVLPPAEAAPAPVLRPRANASLADRLALSVLAREGTGSGVRTARVPDLLAARARSGGYVVDRVPLDDLSGWSFAPGTGDLAHDSGRFFSVAGLRAEVGGAAPHGWEQPVIHQPEVGILGLLARESDGVLHFLMQAKMEPGNAGLVQLSPTVQATRSNYTKVHRGRDVAYLEHFRGPSRGRVLADVLQSEHGSWFFHKTNRNMVVEVPAGTDVPLREGYFWLTLGQLGELLRHDDVVNMDSRSVIACLPFAPESASALHADTEVRSWFTEERALRDVRAELTPLATVTGWHRDRWSIAHEQGRYFEVVGVSVRAEGREVPQWNQPLFRPLGTGVTAFVTRRFGGVRHVLAAARREGGFLDTVELGPTVQCTPANHAHLPTDRQPPFLSTVLAAPRSAVLFGTVLSEEGGRFLRARSRYLIVEADESTAPTTPPPGFVWLTPGQLNALTQHGHYVNVQARSLLAPLLTTEDPHSPT